MTGVAASLRASLGPLAAPLEKLGARWPGLWLAGGAVRDAVRGRPVHDADLAVAKGSVRTVGKAFADATGGALVVLAEGRLVRVVLPGATVDFTPLRAASLIEDLRLRDFTVNAMAVALPVSGGGAIEDPTGGLADLRKKRLRVCGPSSFKDDPVRLWRYHRMAVELGLKADPATARLVRKEAGLAKKCTPERLRDELIKLLSGAHPAKALAAARASGVLLATFPEMAPMAAVRVPGSREVIDVLDHTLEALGHLDSLLGRVRQHYPVEGDEIGRSLASELVSGRPRVALLRLALLFHDVAKPETVSRGPDKVVHFLEHEHRGAKRAVVLLRQRLRLAENELDSVSNLIFHHLRPGYLAASPKFGDRAAWRLVRDAGPDLFSLLLHAQADRMATHHYHGVSAAAQRSAILRILGVRRAALARQGVKRLVDGHDVMKALGLKPGPEVGKALKAAEEAVALGKARTRQEALAAARRGLDRP